MPKSRTVQKKSVQKPRVQKSAQKPRVQKPVMQKPRVQKPVMQKQIQPQPPKEWCDGILSDIKDINIRKKILQDVDNGFYGDFYERYEPKEEYSDWNDMNEQYPTIPDTSIVAFFNEARLFARNNLDKLTLTSLFYEELRIIMKNVFLPDLCRSIFSKKQTVITPKIVMLSVNMLPLKDGPSEKYIVPHDKFKRIFNSVARDFSDSSYTIDENAFYLLHNMFEHFTIELIAESIKNSALNNHHVQLFHLQKAFYTQLYNKYNIVVPLSSNPLAKMVNESNFKDMIKSVIQQIHPSLGISEDALFQLNRLGNAIAKELVDISLYMKNHFEMDDSSSMTVAIRNVLPGELAKHAVSEGNKALQTNGTKLSGKFDGKIDNIKLIGKNSILVLRAVIEYIMAELIELSGSFTIEQKLNIIETKHIKYISDFDLEISILLNDKLKLYFVCPEVNMIQDEEDE